MKFFEFPSNITSVSAARTVEHVSKIPISTDIQQIITVFFTDRTPAFKGKNNIIFFLNELYAITSRNMQKQKNKKSWIKYNTVFYT